MSDDLSIPSPTYRVPRHRVGMEPGTKRLALIAGGLGAALLVFGGGWALMGQRSTTVPVVQADNRPIRVKPENPGGLQVSGAHDDILSGGNDNQAAGKLAPPPEVPAPQALRAPPPSAPPASAPAASPAATAPQAAAAPAAVATATPVVAKPSVAVKPAEPAEKRPAAAGVASVQLAAVSTEEAARSEWQRLSKRLPDLLGSQRPAFTKTERDGRTLWRVRTGGFADVAAATSFCGKMRAKGAACAVAEF